GGVPGRADQLQPRHHYDGYGDRGPGLHRTADGGVRGTGDRAGTAGRAAAYSGRTDRPEPGDEARESGDSRPLPGPAARHAAGGDPEGGGPGRVSRPDEPARGAGAGELDRREPRAAS